MSSQTPADKKAFIRNPYIIGVPINNRENFFGREELFQFLTSVLSEGAKVILLHGQRRIGKTSVLRQIPNFVNLDNFIFVTFDLQDQTRLPLSVVLSNLATEIVDQIASSVDVRLSAPPPEFFESDPYTFTRSFLLDVFNALKGKHLVMLLDEFDVLSTYREDTAVQHFFPFLQSIINQQTNLHVIAVVGRRLDEIPMLLSLFKGAPNQEIGLLDRRGAERLITKPAAGILEYDPAAIQALLELSECHPYFTQLLCHVTFAAVREENRATVVRSDIQGVIDKAIVSGEAGLVWFREGLPIAERVIFSAVAEAQEIGSLFEESSQSRDSRLISPGITRQAWRDLLNARGIVSTEELNLAEQRLLEWGFIKVDGDNSVINVEAQRIRLTIELVRRWLLKRHQVKLAMRELEKVSLTAEALYKEGTDLLQQGDPQSALQKFRSVLEENPNHFHALFNLTQLSLEIGDVDQAAELYERTYKIDPLRCKEGLVRALSESAYAQLAKDNFDLALKRVERAAELEPSDPAIIEQLKYVRERHRRTLAQYNPFIVGTVVPPDQFVGREKEVDTIFSRILKGGHVAVCGERRMGKTSLLRYLTSPDVWRKRNFPIENRIVITLDCSSIMPFSQDRFRQEIFLELREQASDIIETTASIQDLNDVSNLTVRDLRRLLMSFGKRGLSLLLLIDEFDVALQPTETYTEADMMAFLHEMRSVAGSAEGEYFSSVISTRRRPRDFALIPASLMTQGGGPSSLSSSQSSFVGSPWYNYYSVVPLRLFEEHDVEALLAKMPDTFVLSPAELHWVRHVSGGHPFLLQAELSIIFQCHVDERDFTIEQATKELLGIAESLFLTLWNGASDFERVLLTITALRDYGERMPGEGVVFQGYEAIISRSERELRDLEDRSILVRQTKNANRYAFFSPLMSWWVIKEIEARTDDEIFLQTETFAKFVDSASASQLLNLLLEVRLKNSSYRALTSWIV
jgi:tetratricopeptide (TPR) repeat protein